MTKVPVISVTDLYHPPEDPGDNFDLVMPYGLPEVDLEAVILDALEEKRDLVDGGVPGYPGPRDPGIIPVTQLNAIFGRNVPYAMTPFTRMRSGTDTMTDTPRFQQFGVDLLLETLDRSDQPVHIMSFGSARPIAVAYNREPSLVASKMACLHLCAGTTTPTYPEWNVVQDPIAMIRLLEADLPIALYPCATVEGCYAYDEHNTFYWLHDLAWIADMHPQLSRYLDYAMARSMRMDYLRVLQETEPAADVARRHAGHRHAVWETAAWIQVSGRRIVQRPNGKFRIVPATDVTPEDIVIRNDLVPCRVTPEQTGLFSFELTGQPSNVKVFQRDDPATYEKALNEALPALYQSFTPDAWPNNG